MGPLRLALGKNPYEKLPASALSPAAQACVGYNCLRPNRAKRHRHRVTKHLETLGELLRPLQQRLSRNLPASAHAQKLHSPLIAALVTQPRYAEKTLRLDLARGIPIGGGIPQSSTIPKQVTHATMSLNDVRWGLALTNGEVLKSLSKYTKRNDVALRGKRWGIFRAEFRKGWLDEPTPASRSYLRRAILSPMMRIAEHHGIQEPRSRLIGDLATSNVDKTVQMSETYCHQGLELFFASTDSDRIQHI